MRTAGKLAWSLWIAVALVTVAVFVTAAVTGPIRTQVPSGYPTEQLQADLQMTQQMGVPGAAGSIFEGTADEQLRRSLADPGYAATLEAQQRQIDRMLGRATP